MGTCFWEKFESFLFILTCVALPVFVLSIFFPSFFHSLSSVFQILTYKSLYVFKESQANYWYSFFFVFDGRNSGRNCGFMWEPGAFAMILTIAIIYNFLKNGVQMNRHIVIYTIAILTTFSTLGYIALGVLLLLFLIEANNLIYRLCIIGILLYSIVVLIPTVDFLGEKINEYIEETQNKVAYPQNLQESESEKYEVNRLYTFILNFQKTLLIPTGYGATEDTISNMAKQDLVGINGLGAIMVSWGFLGLLVAFISIYKFCSLYEKEHTFIFPALCTIAVCIVFFSNPIDRNPIFFLIVLTPYCLR
jgi:hypothetical protein